MAHTRMNVEAHLSASWPLEHLEYVVRCPVCDASRRDAELQDLEDRTFGTAPGKWTLYRCLECHARYLDPRPDAKSIHLAYENYYTHGFATADAPSTGSKWLQVALTNGYRNHLFGTRFQPSLGIAPVVAPLFGKRAARIRAEARGIEKLRGTDRRILDVGCGSGQFLAFAKQMGWQPYGVEPDPVAADVARRLGIDVLANHVPDLNQAYANWFDAVTLSHVIEHAHNPIEMLVHCRRVLKPGGYLWLETPNIDSAGYEFFGRHWRGLETPRHLVLFSSQSLRVALQKSGFEQVSILPCIDATKHMFRRSAIQQAGRIAEVDRGALSREINERLRIQIRHARSIVRQAPERSELVVATAYRAG